MTEDAKKAYHLIAQVISWENEESVMYIIRQAFKDEPNLAEHLINKYFNECNSDWCWLLMNIDAHCFQKFFDYAQHC